MSKPAKILIIFGTRPEAIKLFPVVAALKADPRFMPVVCVSAQHRGMLDQVLEIAGLVPDYDLDLMKPDQTLDGLTAALLTGLGQVMDEVQPARVMVQGDTATAMAGALAAYYRKLPVDHVEAGLRSGNIYHPWPEEVNRKVIGTIASLHFAPTEVSAAALTSVLCAAGDADGDDLLCRGGGRAGMANALQQAGASAKFSLALSPQALPHAR